MTVVVVHCPRCDSTNVVPTLYDPTCDCIDCGKHFDMRGPPWRRLMFWRRT